MTAATKTQAAAVAARDESITAVHFVHQASFGDVLILLLVTVTAAARPCTFTAPWPARRRLFLLIPRVLPVLDAYW